MKVLYRVSPFESPNIVHQFKGRKDELINLCLTSLIKAGATDITFLTDRISPDRFKLYGEVIDCSGLGNVGTFQKQLELGRQYDKVFFCEDDYLWRPNTFTTFENAVDSFDFLSPYDHPAHYIEERFDKHYETKLFNGFTYREAPSNTLTFATSGKLLNDLYIKMLTYGINDHPMFDSLRKDGYRIWNPCYSFATHLAEGWEAPNFPFIENLVK